jgi:hypothetical protein
MKKILQILLIDILLFIGFIILIQFAAFFLGYSSTNNHVVEERILIGVFILGNLVTNYLINKKMHSKNYQMLISSVFVLMIYAALLVSSLIN